MASLTPLMGSDEADVEVEWRDQQQINEFGRLNPKKKQLEEDVAQLKKMLTALDDAEEAVEMIIDAEEDGALRVVIGDSFIDATEDEANDFLTAEKESKGKLLAEMEHELATIEARQQELKKSLYSRFGKAINLEDD